MKDTYDMIETGAVSPLGDDLLVAAARMAEQRIDAVIKIKQMALRVTNVSDWTDQQGKPYLQVSGSEKVANLYSVSWKIDEPVCEYEESGHFTYTYHGVFSMMGRSIEVEGSRSSKDPFFKRYNWVGGQKIEKPIADLDKRDVKMAAMTNLLGNGITRILGIRNLTWDDLEKFANITQSDITNKINYKKDGEEQAAPTVARKSDTTGSGKTPHQALKDELDAYVATVTESRADVLKAISLFINAKEEEVFMRNIPSEGKNEKWVGTALGKLRKLAEEGTGEAEQAQEQTTAPEGWKDPSGCQHKPTECDHSGWIDGKPYCGPDGPECPYFVEDDVPL